MHTNPIVKLKNHILGRRELKKKIKISKMISMHIIKMRNDAILQDIILIENTPYYIQFGNTDNLINSTINENMISRLSDNIDSGDIIQGQHSDINVYKMACKDLSADRFLHSSVNEYSIVSLTIHHPKSYQYELDQLQDIRLRLEVEIQTDMARFNCIYKLNEKREFVMFKYKEIIPNNKGEASYVG